jgi:hypothetical protein
MELNLKLIIAIILALIIGGVIGSVVTRSIVTKDVSEEKDYLVSPQFLSSLYDADQKEFKLGKDSPASLEATYYALVAAKDPKIKLPEEIDIDGVFDKIRSHYVPDGYYFEEDKDPVVSTRMALEIDSYYSQNLNQEVNLDWVKINSLENKELEEIKFDPQYQENILKIYQYLNIGQKEAKERISSLYLDYYCDYNFKEISEEDYLRKKYCQVSIVAYFTGAETILSDGCFGEEEIEFDKDRLGKINFEELNDIKEIYWLYYLKKFYNLNINPREVLVKINEFYSGKGIKEKLTDEKPNLIGVFFYADFFNRLKNR